MNVSCFVIFAFATISVATCRVQLPCDSVLRRFPSLSIFFEHCVEIGCRYGNWSDVKPADNAIPVAVPFDRCKSELALPGERRQVATESGGHDCEDKREESYICISTCVYSDWTDVISYADTPARLVPQYQCRSGRAVLGERWKIAEGGYECSGSHCEECLDKIERRYLCEPTLSERLVILFELGRTGQNHLDDSLDLSIGYGSGIRRRSSLVDSVSLTPFENYCDPTPVCRGQRVKRDSYANIEKLPEQSHIRHQHTTANPQPLPVDPIPFDLFAHGGRYRRQNEVKCHPKGTRYVLFILDTSGSIEPYDFQRMTSTLSILVHYFCRRIKIAAVTFSDDYFIEFCFDCFGNSCGGRDDARDAMAGIKYRGGLTFTGEITQCVCDNVLTPECGFPELPTDGTTCLDIVYVTDGWSNGPADVCQKVECLYDLERWGSVELNVFAFGIGGYNLTELKCITRDRSVNYINNAIFEVNSFDEFEEAIRGIASVFDWLASGNTDTMFPFLSGSGFGSVSASGASDYNILDAAIEMPDCFAIDAYDGGGSKDCSN